MHTSARTLALLTACLLGVGGCRAPIGAASHSVFETVHDDQLTYDDFDGVMDWDAPSGDPIADGIVPVHEFNQGDVEQGGGVRVIPGKDWLSASDFERNRMLLAVQENQPVGAVCVVVVATGDVWLVPPGSDNLIESGLIREWHFDEYSGLAEYVGQRRLVGLTLSQYMRQTAVVRTDELPPIHYVHDFGPIGLSDIKTAHGFQILTPDMWNYATPQWRFSELHAFGEFLGHRPEFEAPKNGIAFGVAVPWGSVYVMPKANYDYLLGTSLKLWNQYQILALPQVPASTDRWIRNGNTIDTFTLGFRFVP